MRLNAFESASSPFRRSGFATLRFGQSVARPSPQRDKNPLMVSRPGRVYVMNPTVTDKHCIYRISVPRQQGGLRYIAAVKVKDAVRTIVRGTDRLLGTNLFDYLKTAHRKHMKVLPGEMVSELGISPLDAEGRLTTKTPYQGWIKPTGNRLEMAPNGYEDPRSVTVDGKTYILHSVVDSHRMSTSKDLSKPAYGLQIGLCEMNPDGLEVKELGIIGPETYNRNASFFPKKFINPATGRPAVMMLLKNNPGIAAVFLPEDFETTLLNDDATRIAFWKKALADKNQIIMGPQFKWEKDHIALSQTPIETDAGWLVIYHATDENRVYRMGMAILDKNNPRRVLHRSPSPMMEPELPSEKSKGLTKNVIFPTGGRIVADGKMPGGQDLQIYYGAGDCEIRRAHFPLKTVLDYLKQFDSLGDPVTAEAAVQLGTATA